MTTFTKDDVGKAVETTEGTAVGVVAAVDRETAYVEPDPGITDSVRASLGWGETADDAVPLADSGVREITEDAVVLAETVPEDALAADRESPDERTAGGARDVEGSRGDPVDPLGSETRADVSEREADVREAEGGVAETEPDATESDPDGPESGATGPDRRPESAEDAEPALETDRADDVAEGGAGTDAAAEIDGDAERRNADGRPSVEEMDPVGEMDGPDEMDGAEGMGGPERMDPIDELSDSEEMASTEEMADADELDSVEAEARRDLEVDPTELTDRDPEVEVRPDEDVGDRTDAEVDPVDLSEETGGPTTEDASKEERSERDDRDDGR